MFSVYRVAVAGPGRELFRENSRNDAIGFYLLEILFKHPVDHHDLCPAVVHDVLDLGRREPPVDRHAHGADLVRAEHERDALRGVLGEACDPVARAEAELLQALRDAACRVLDLGEGPGPRRRPVGGGAAFFAGAALDRLGDHPDAHPPPPLTGACASRSGCAITSTTAAAIE